MNILQTSVSAGILIAAIVALRAFAGGRLSKMMLLVLWKIALLRLIFPFSIPSPYQVYTIINRTSEALLTRFGLTDNKGEPGGLIPIGTEYVEAAYQPPQAEPLIILWITGAAILALFFAVSFYKCTREINTALPIKGDAFIEKWLSEHKLRRTIKILVSDQMTTPIAYGIIKPRIILPKTMDFRNEAQMRYVLTHEFIHIRRFDALWKPILIITLIFHWFNPMAWILYILMNRDLEMACDEKVIQLFGENSKSDYALSIIDMAERKMKFTPLFSSYSMNVTEERIVSIMKFKKASLLGIVLVCLFAAGSTTVFVEKVVDFGFQLHGIIQINSDTFSFEVDKRGTMIVKDADGNIVSRSAVGSEGMTVLPDGSRRMIKIVQLDDLDYSRKVVKWNVVQWMDLNNQNRL